jgi:Holliday junction resolvase RusA-like endonuclease
MKTQSIILPIPPSANNLWRLVVPKNPKKGKPKALQVMTDVYAEWLAECTRKIKRGLEAVVSPPVGIQVEIRSGFDCPRSRDLDNFLKPIVDLIRKSKIIPNDNLANVTKIFLFYTPRSREIEADCVITIGQLVMSLFD